MNRSLRGLLALLPLVLVLDVAACDDDRPPPATPQRPAVPTAPPTASAAANDKPAFAYPATKQADVVDTYFGVAYHDPYRWLEDLKAPETADWFKAQATLTDGLLDRIAAKDALVREWKELDKLQPASYRDFVLEGGRIFYRKTLGGENVGRVYYRDGWKGKEKLLFDPATYKAQHASAGQTVTVNSFLPSWSGKTVALALTSGGAEYSEIRVLDVDKGTLSSETMYPSYGPIGWAADGRSFFYDAGKETDITSQGIELHRKTRLHTLGAEVSSDRDVFSDESATDVGITPKEFPNAYVPEEEPSLLLGWVGTVQTEVKLYAAKAAELAGKQTRWRKIIDPSDSVVRGVAFAGDNIYGVTYAGAPRYKVVRTSLSHPDWKNAETIIPESSDAIDSMVRSRDSLFVVYSNGVTGKVVRYDLKSKKQSELALPEKGIVTVTCPDIHSNRCIVSVDTWTKPRVMFDYDGDASTVAKSEFAVPVSYPAFDQLVTEEVLVPSHDGAMVPLSIVHKKDLPMDGSRSAILEGYGAYGISITPSFSVRRSIALHDVVYAVAHVRGGSEKGEAWYRAGFKGTKENTWKDFIAAGDYLVKKGYTSPQKLAGTGTSAGGILISRAVTERPDLFAAAVCNVGMGNAMRSESMPNGPVNAPEFGSVTDEKEAKWLFAMDGMQHVEKGVKYPAVLAVAGWNDPRVAPWQPGKFAAAVQAASASGRPVLVKVNYDDGHFTEEKEVTFRNFAAQDAFMLWQTGHAEFQPAAASK